MTIQKVFINRTLNLKKIKYIGLDMDHTLIRYNSRAFEALAYREMAKKLVRDKGYPEAILSFPFDFDSAIRGLVVDYKHGNLLKVSRHGAIRMSQHGTQAIDFFDQQKLYKSTYIDLQDDKTYFSIDTVFSISFAVLYSHLIDYKDGPAGSKLPTYEVIGDDVLEAMDGCHTDGSIKKAVAENLEEYVVRDEKLIHDLERYIKHGKKIFILTNSEFYYTKLLLDYAITPFLKDHESWLDLFEFVITEAKKPRFFYEDIKFLKIDPKTSTMTPYEDRLKKGVYQNGCAKRFTDDLNLQGDDILYIGDHIYGDILRLKKDCNWRTALVIEELADEIDSLTKSVPYIKEIRSLMKQKNPLELTLVDLISAQIEGQKNVSEELIRELQTRVKALDRQISPLIIKQQQLFNHRWGEVMRSGNEESYFAHQVDRFACIYMTKLDDLLELSPRSYFRALRRPLAHELALHL
jgi:HAD superfamily 5'-nucleotidase-like hydrolase